MQTITGQVLAKSKLKSTKIQDHWIIKDSLLPEFGPRANINTLKIVHKWPIIYFLTSFKFREGGFMKLYNLIIKDQETTNNKVPKLPSHSSLHSFLLHSSQKYQVYLSKSLNNCLYIYLQYTLHWSFISEHKGITLSKTDFRTVI